MSAVEIVSPAAGLPTSTYKAVSAAAGILVVVPTYIPWDPVIRAF